MSVFTNERIDQPKIAESIFVYLFANLNNTMVSNFGIENIYKKCVDREGNMRFVTACV